MGPSKTSVDSGFQKNAAAVVTVRTANSVFMLQCYSVCISRFSYPLNISLISVLSLFLSLGRDGRDGQNGITLQC